MASSFSLPGSSKQQQQQAQPSSQSAASTAMIGNHSSHGGSTNPSSNSQGAFATSTLLREISMLRARLKDLEDDGRSSVVSSSCGGANAAMDDHHRPLPMARRGSSAPHLPPPSPSSVASTPPPSTADAEALLNSVRKELSKVSHEKANLEREFMNQMSSLAAENRQTVSDLQDQLVRVQALNDELQDRVRSSGRGNGGGSSSMAAAADQTRELDQLRRTLASSDMEIAETRRDMDLLHAKLDELVVEKDFLERHILEVECLYNEEKREANVLREQLKVSDNARAQLQRDLDHKTALVERHLQEVGTLNDSVIQLQNHKDMLVTEITDLKMAQSKQGGKKESQQQHTSRSVPTSTAAEGGVPEQKLTDDIRLLESRLARFQDKLNERDRTIDNLADSLNEERRASKALKVEIKVLKQQNSLQEAAARSAASLSPQRTTTKALASSSAPSSPPALTRLATNNNPDSVEGLPPQPRTPVSGLVASFERRITGTTPSTGAPTPTATKSPESGPSHMEGPGKIPLVRVNSVDRRPPPIHTAPEDNDPNNNASVLRFQLNKEKQVVLELQDKLRQEKALVQQLRTELSEAAEAHEQVDHLRAQLLDREDAVARLTAKVQDDTRSILELEETLRREQEASRKLRVEMNESPRNEMRASMGLNQLLQREQALVKDLRAELAESAARHDADASALDEFRGKLQIEQDRVQELRAELADALTRGSGGNAELESKLAESQREIERLRCKIQGYEAEKLGFQESSRKAQNELSKLRMKTHQAQSEKKVLQTKVSSTHREVERLRDELTYQMEVCSIQDEKKEEVEEDAETVRLRDQVSALHSELVMAQREIEKLQGEVEQCKQALVEAQKKTEEPLSKSAQRAYDARINQLQVDLTRVQVAKDEMEQEYTKKLRDLEDELQAIEAEAEQEIDQRDVELEELREKLAKEEATVVQLQAEHAQICHSMNDVSTSRQDDMEELQAELIAMTSKTSAQAREIQSLKLKIEEYETRRQDVADKYEARIRDLEDEIAALREDAQQLDPADLENLKSENSRLRETIRNVTMERRALKDRLDSLMSDKTSSKSAQVLRDRNNALKEEVEKLTKRLKKMEASITRFAI